MIKQCVGQRCMVWEDNYTHTYRKLLRLIAAAQADFGDEPLEFEIGVLGGDRHYRQMCIEFVVPNGVAIPDTYVQVTHFVGMLL